MQICTLPQTDNHTSTPPLSVSTDRMPFLPPNQQRQSTEDLTLCGFTDALHLLPLCCATAYVSALLLQLQPFYCSLDFVQDNPSEPVPEETFTHSHLSWSSIICINIRKNTGVDRQTDTRPLLYTYCYGRGQCNKEFSKRKVFRRKSILKHSTISIGKCSMLPVKLHRHKNSHAHRNINESNKWHSTEWTPIAQMHVAVSSPSNKLTTITDWGPYCHSL